MKEMCNEILEQKKITYVPPSQKLVREYATLVCNDLAACSQNRAGQIDEIANGLASFLIALSDMYTKHLNRSLGTFNETEDGKVG